MSILKRSRGNGHDKPGRTSDQDERQSAQRPEHGRGDLQAQGSEPDASAAAQSGSHASAASELEHQQGQGKDAESGAGAHHSGNSTSKGDEPKSAGGHRSGGNNAGGNGQGGQDGTGQNGRGGRPIGMFTGAFITLAAVGVSIWFLKEQAELFAPIFFALNLMITAYPLHVGLRKLKVPAALAAIVTGLVVLLVLALFVYGLYYSVAEMVSSLPQYSEQFKDLYNQALHVLTNFGWDENRLLEQIKKIDPQNIVSVAGGLLSNLSGAGSILVIIISCLIFMIMDTPDTDERLAIARRSHPQFVESLADFTSGIRRYWIVTTVFGLIVAVLDWAVLVGLGVPLAFVWAIFSFLTNYIPNIGFVIGLIPPTLLGLFQSGFKTAIAVIIAYSVLNFVVQSIIQPKVAGNAVGLSPTLSFISLLFWTAVLGPLGALLALPMSLLIKALLIDSNPEIRWVNALISSRPRDAEEPVDHDEPIFGS